MAAGRRCVGLAEAFEHVREEVGRDADARVAHANDHLLVLASQAHRHLAVRGRELDGIGQQIPHHLLQAARVGPHPSADAVKLRRQFDLLRERRRRGGLDRRLDHQPRLDEFGLQPHASGHDAAHVQQVIDQLGLQAGVAFDGVDGLRDHVRILLGAKDVGPAQHRVQGRAQLVRQRRQELVLQRAEALGLQPQRVLAIEQLLPVPCRLHGCGEDRVSRFEPRVIDRRQHGDRQHGHGGQHDEGGQLRERELPRGRPADAVGAKARGRHAGVVHCDDGESHDDRGTASIGEDSRRGTGAQVEADPQRRRRRGDGDGHGGSDQPGRVGDGRVHAHRRHADVVHGIDAHAQEHARSRKLCKGELRLAQLPERHGGHEDGQQPREQRDAEVVTQRDRQAERQHAHEVHAPDAGAHREGTAGHPPPGHAMRLPHAFGQAQGGVRREDGHQDRQQYQGCFVVSGQHAANSLLLARGLSGCSAECAIADQGRRIGAVMHPSSEGPAGGPATWSSAAATIPPRPRSSPADVTSAEQAHHWVVQPSEGPTAAPARSAEAR